MMMDVVKILSGALHFAAVQSASAACKRCDALLSCLKGAELADATCVYLVLYFLASKSSESIAFNDRLHWCVNRAFA